MKDIIWFGIGAFGGAFTITIAIIVLMFTIITGETLEIPLWLLPMLIGGIMFALGVKKSNKSCNCR